LKDESKTKKQLIAELAEARHRISQLLTESQCSKEALESKAGQPQALMDSAPVIMCQSDLTTKITYVNKKFEEVTGYAREDVLGKHWGTLGVLSRKNARLLTKRMAEKLKGSPPTPMEVQIKRKDGQSVWVTGIGEIVREHGRPVGFQVIAQDITNQKLDQQKIENAAKEWRTTFDAVSDWVSMHDRDFRILRLNKALADALGMTPQEIIDKTCYELIHGTKEPWPDCPHRKALDTGRPAWDEFFEPKLGIHIEASCSPIFNDSGETTGTVHIFRDITRRKLMEKTLRESEKRYRLVTENVADVIWVVDLNMHPTYMSPSITRLLGYTVEEAMAKPMEEVFTPASYKLAMKALAEELAIEKGKEKDLERSRALEVELNRKDGSVVPVEIKCTFLRDAKAQPVEILVVARDTTERRRAEQELRESERKYRAIFETTGTAMVIIEEDFTISLVNTEVERLFGYSRAEVENKKNWAEFVYAGDLDRLKEHHRLRRIDPDAVPKQYEARIIDRKGNIKNTLVSVGMIPGTDKSVASIIDITERKQQELEYKTILQTTIDGFWLADMQGRFLDVNDAYCRLIGYSRDELLKMSIPDIEAIERPEETAARIAKIRKVGGDRFETRHRCKDGRIVDVEISVNYLEIGDGRMVVFIRDITERKKMEEKLKESEELYRTLVELGDRIGEAIIMRQDTEQGEGMHVFVSDAWSRMTGYSEEELLNMSFFKLVHPKYRKNSLARYRRRMRGESIPGLFEISIVRKDGTEVPIELTSAYTTYRGKRALVAFIRDISERRKMREQLIMQDRLASIGQLTSGVAHELNNPLTSVVGFSSLLLQRELPDDVMEDLKTINSEAQRTANIVKNLLTFSRKQSQEKQPMVINESIQRVLELRAYEQKVYNIQVNTRFDPDLPQIMGNSSQLQQVFLNIIINAEFFMVEAHGKGTLTVTTEKVGDYVRASFADDGPGILEENKSSLFTPFFTTKEVGKGTGLGLSICHGIVTEHGGRIWAESELGRGATFIIELPVYKSSSQEDTK